MREPIQRTVCRLGFALIDLLLPARHHDWRSAMITEYVELPPERRPRWLAGLIFAACRLRAREPLSIYAASATAAMASLIVIDWSTANDATSLTALVLSAACLGFLRPQSLNLSGVLIGGVLLIAHALANFTGTAIPFYQCKPLTSGEFLVLAALILPAVASANAGAAVRPLLHAND